MAKVFRLVYRWSVAEGIRAKALLSATVLPWRFPLLFSLNREESRRETVVEEMEERRSLGLKPKIGLGLGVGLFLLLLLVPPPERMYIPATKVVLRHCQKGVVQTLLRGTSLAGEVRPIQSIDARNIRLILERAKGMRVKVPKNFHSSGVQGISLSAEGQPLREVINHQVGGLKKTIGLALLMAILWITEALPIPVTALLPLVLLPLLGIAHYKYAQLPGYFVAYAPYMHYLVVLFIGGFTIAEAMKRWRLHERIALHFIRLIGFSPRRIILGLMVATAVLSMFVSNTATTAMMMPIGLAIILEAGGKPGESRFGLALMLGIAYAASIGGIGTLIGTPPNVVLAGFADALLHIKVTFAGWLRVGLPLVVVLLPLTWLMLLKLNPFEELKFAGSRGLIARRIRSLGPLRGGELNTFVIFLVIALMWIFQKPISGALHLPWLGDSVISIIGLLLFYLVPVSLRRWEFTLDWQTNLQIPWGTLLLFGGGIALGQALDHTGGAEFIAMHLVALRAVPHILLLFFIILLVDFLTEVTSNTATTNMMMPVLVALGMAIGRDPLTLMIGGAVAASMAFMLPVATPPNAIVYGTGFIRMGDMVRNGFLLDLLAASTWTVILYFVVSLLSPLVTIR